MTLNVNYGETHRPYGQCGMAHPTKDVVALYRVFWLRCIASCWQFPPARSEEAMGTPTPPPAITAAGLRKRYGDTVVLDGVDLTIGQGEVFALLGPNGAGKTTTVRILSALIRADGGT